MENIDYLTEYKDLYYKEIDLLDRLNGRVPNNIGFLSLVGTGIIFLYQELLPLSFDIFNIISILFLSFTTIFFIITIVCFCKAYVGYDYHYFPIEKMHTLIDENLKYAENSKETVIKNMVDENIVNRVKDAFITSAICNRQQNIRKMNNQRIFTNFLLISFSLLAISFLLWAMFNALML